MGKALIIKDADFSENAIENINFDGIRRLTMENALGEYPYDILVRGNTVTFTSNATKKFKIFKVNANEILEIPKQSGYYQVFFTLDYNIATNTNKAPAFENCIGLTTTATNVSNEDKSTHSLCIKGDKEYYVYVLYDGAVGSNSKPVSFPTMLVAKQEYIPNRIFTEENYDSSLYSCYFNQETYGIATPRSDGKPTIMAYNLNKGETVHIKAGSEDSRYKIIKQSVPIIGNSSTVTVSAGDETTVDITDVGLAIAFYLGETGNKFPAELYTTLTPVVDSEINE